MNSIIGIVVTSFILGLVHGVTPDEHTWPITFTYAMGVKTAKKGMLAALIFSLAFTLQRSFITEVIGLVGKPLDLTIYAGIVYAIVGIVMMAAGAYILRYLRYPHFHFLKQHGHFERSEEECKDCAKISTNAPAPKMALIHGFIAGFGVGPFFLAITGLTLLVPPSIGFVTGLAFGLGTTLMLIILGFAIGFAVEFTQKKFKKDITNQVQKLSGYILFYGGIIFIAIGILVNYNIIMLG